MLKYSIKLNENSFNRDALDWDEKYLDPNLSFISGTTSPLNHLEKFAYLASSNSINNTDSTLSVSSINVRREGYVVISGKTFDIKELEYKDKTYKYVFINGKYFYNHILNASETGIVQSGFTIDNIQYEHQAYLDSYDGTFADVIDSFITIPITGNETTISIDAIAWIEDGSVEIDGQTYVFNKDEQSPSDSNVFGGTLTETVDGEPLSASDITNCDSIICKPYESVKDCYDITKFSLTKSPSVEKIFSNITFCSYVFYVKYKQYYCPIRKVTINTGETTSYKFVCEIPNYILGGDDISNTYFDLYYLIEYADSASRDAECGSAVANEQLINSENKSTHGVVDMDDLRYASAFISINGMYLFVQSDIANSNEGKEIIVYLEDKYTPLEKGDRIVFNDNSTKFGFQSTVYDESFIVYNGNKYLLEENLMDKMDDGIGGEYDIDYINGKISGETCMVSIDGEQVPFLIKAVSGGTYSGGTLQRYGLIVVPNNTNSASLGIYSIKPYSGVTIQDEKYIVNKYSNENIFANLGISNKYTFTVLEKLGSSTYICAPYMNENDFDEDFIRDLSKEICSDVVSNQRTMSLIIENKIFGEMPITKELALYKSDTPISSDDYYSLFDDLVIYLNNGYIHIPINLDIKTGGNPLQDDVVSRDFVDAEKKKVINPIVDMEKDVYLPKYIVSNDGKYSGSTTVFKPIKQINLNFHFRTRNLESWKVNEGYDNISSSGTDGWFVTDYYPYKDKLANNELQETSDLMGLLYFTNNDIFYQKSRVAKSFARLSYYDSTDEQSQSLLAMSSVFVDEHKLFKKYIDNSRKNVNNYKLVNIDKTTFDNEPLLNKIHVMSELVVKNKNENNPSYSVEIDEDKRISSRLEIKNKYESDTSSEGFYLYIFREYSEKLHPKPIYMRVDFNHAGIGKSIPFIIPMKWSGETNYNSEEYNKLYAISALTLSNVSDLSILKEGVPLSCVNSQMYIPLYAMYDFKNKEYAYVFDSRYVTVKDGIANINLFELKIKNESNEPRNQELIDITTNRQIRGVVNINNSQFNTNNQ